MVVENYSRYSYFGNSSFGSLDFSFIRIQFFDTQLNPQVASNQTEWRQTSESASHSEWHSISKAYTSVKLLTQFQLFIRFCCRNLLFSFKFVGKIALQRLRFSFSPHTFFFVEKPFDNNWHRHNRVEIMILIQNEHYLMHNKMCFII